MFPGIPKKASHRLQFPQFRKGSAKVKKSKALTKVPFAKAIVITFQRKNLSPE
jgi:hypothetical protein